MKKGCTFIPFEALVVKEWMAKRIMTPSKNNEEAKKAVQDYPLLNATHLLDSKFEATAVKNKLTEFLNEGHYNPSGEPLFYLYSLSYQGHTQIGIVGAASLQDYQDHKILKHEDTLDRNTEEKKQYLKAQEANIEPVYLVYDDVPGLELLPDLTNWITGRKPVVEFTNNDDHVEHKIWLTRREESAIIQDFFRDRIERLYIADGHHRIKAASDIMLDRKASSQTSFSSHSSLSSQSSPRFDSSDPFSFIMSIVFPASQAKIWEFNRLIRDTNGKSTDTILLEAGTYFDIMQLPDNFSDYKPKAKGQFTMRLDGHWYSLTAKPNLDNEKLDVQILQDTLIGPVFGITNPRVDPRIGFCTGLGGINEIVEHCQKGDAKIGIACYPIQFFEVKAIADQHKTMPPKSTCFYPKPRAGGIIRLLQKNNSSSWIESQSVTKKGYRSTSPPRNMSGYFISPFYLQGYPQFSYQQILWYLLLCNGLQFPCVPPAEYLFPHW